jgi:hypothetical protein
MDQKQKYLTILKETISEKEFIYVLLPMIFGLLVYIFKWGLVFSTSIITFFIGILIGIYFLDIAEKIFDMRPSPFRSIVFCGVFVFTAIFILTSSGSMLASGLVLSVFITLITWMINDYKYAGNLDSWYHMVAGQVSKNIQQYIMIGFVVMFFVATFLFIRA